MEEEGVDIVYPDLESMPTELLEAQALMGDSEAQQELQRRKAMPDV